MQEILQFAVRHWDLCLALAVVLALLVKLEFSGTVGGIRLLTPAEVIEFINRRHALVLDLREETAYRAGHITGAQYLPFAAISDNLKKFQKYKSKPIILVCQQGQQAPKAAGLLLKEGFNEVYALKQGINSWLQANLPLVKERAANG